MPKVSSARKTKEDKVTFDELITQSLQEYAKDFVQASNIWDFLCGRNCGQCNRKIRKTYVRLKQQQVCSSRCLKLKRLKVLK